MFLCIINFKMMKHQTISMHDDSGTEVTAQAPLIISASRATDIPAFYADWFSVDLKRVMLGGEILSQGRIVMFHSGIHVLLFFGRRILLRCCHICL